MTALNVRLPDSLHKRLRVLAEQEGVSINSLISTAVAEKLSALDTETLLLEGARRGSSATFLGVLAKVPSDPPLRGDELLRSVLHSPLSTSRVNP